MGRQIKRVPIDFAHPIDEVWPGFVMPAELYCEVCNGEGYANFDGEDHDCPECEGDGLNAEGRKWTRTEPPTGDAYQIWETVSEGSPITPPFLTPEELASWIVDNPHPHDIHDGLSKETWVQFITGPGWAPSMVVVGGKYRDAIEHAVG